jgi:hypothetical protein
MTEKCLPFREGVCEVDVASRLGESMYRRRWLLWAWIVVSLGWAGFWSWYYRILSCGPLHEGESTGIGWHCDGPPAAGGGYEVIPVPVVVAVVVGLPIAVLIAGIAIRWLFIGSRRNGD